MGLRAEKVQGALGRPSIGFEPATSVVSQIQAPCVWAIGPELLCAGQVHRVRGPGPCSEEFCWELESAKVWPPPSPLPPLSFLPFRLSTISCKWREMEQRKAKLFFNSVLFFSLALRGCREGVCASEWLQSGTYCSSPRGSQINTSSLPLSLCLSFQQGSTEEKGPSTTQDPLS